MNAQFTEEELVTIVRWAEHEERSTSFQSNVERARCIKTKVSAMLAETPSQRIATPSEKAVQPS